MQALKKAHSFTDFLFYVCLMAVPIMTAILGISRHSAGWTAVYVMVCGGMVVLIMKFYCARCPHYTREGRRLKCMFFWNIPKFFTPKPKPLNSMDKLLVFAATVAILLFPLPWLFEEPGLLIVFLLSLAGFAASVRRNECHRCIYFECPMNQASENARAEFSEDSFNE